MEKSNNNGGGLSIRTIIIDVMTKIHRNKYARVNIDSTVAFVAEVIERCVCAVKNVEHKHLFYSIVRNPNSEYVLLDDNILTIARTIVLLVQHYKVYPVDFNNDKFLIGNITEIVDKKLLKNKGEAFSVNLTNRIRKSESCHGHVSRELDITHSELTTQDKEIIESICDKEKDIMDIGYMLGNVCIAKYMKLSPIKGVNERTGKDYYYYNDSVMEDFEPLPSYNRDWNALMWVVEKINLHDSVVIGKNECKIYPMALTDTSMKTFKPIITKSRVREHKYIDVLYEAVLKYCMWYSLNYKSNVEFI